MNSVSLQSNCLVLFVPTHPVPLTFLTKTNMNIKWADFIIAFSATHSTHYKNFQEPLSARHYPGLPFSTRPRTAASAKTQTLAVPSKSLTTQFTLIPAAPPSLPQCRLEGAERAETPHWPRWLAANQLQPKVIGSRWETFLVTRAGGTSCLLKRGGKT